MVFSFGEWQGEPIIFFWVPEMEPILVAGNQTIEMYGNFEGCPFSGWCFHIFFKNIFTLKFGGNGIQFDEHIFQMG